MKEQELLASSHIKVNLTARGFCPPDRLLAGSVSDRPASAPNWLPIDRGGVPDRCCYKADTDKQGVNEILTNGYVWEEILLCFAHTL